MICKQKEEREKNKIEERELKYFGAFDRWCQRAEEFRGVSWGRILVVGREIRFMSLTVNVPTNLTSYFRRALHVLHVLGSILAQPLLTFQIL